MKLEIAGLSFLGLGAEAPSAEWGAMMSNGRSMLQTAPWVILAPGLAIFLTVLVCNLLVEAVRKTVDQGKGANENGHKGSKDMSENLLEISVLSV